MSGRVKWADLVAHGVVVGELGMADGLRRIVLVDGNGDQRSAGWAACGLAPFAGGGELPGVFVLQGSEQRLNGSSIATVLGLQSCPVIETERASVNRQFEEALVSKTGRSVMAVAWFVRELGCNARGERVWQGGGARFVRDAYSRPIAEDAGVEDSWGAARFLRAPTPVALRDCAEGFVIAIRRGAKVSWRDVENFVDITSTSGDGQSRDTRLRAAQEAIEAASYREFARTAAVPDREAFELATALYMGLPVARVRTAESIALQQYSTPLPLGVLAQRLLIAGVAVSGARVLEPAAGNGGLVHLLGGAERCVVDLDPKRVEALQESGLAALLADATTANFRALFGGKPFDYTITNPPFGRMPAARAYDKLPSVLRADHFIALRALGARRDTGRSVMILGADGPRSDGSLSGGSKTLHAYLADHYELLAAVELDGRLYSRQGAGFNIRLLVVGDKRNAPIHAEVPERYAVLTTLEEAWSWADRAIAAYPPRPAAAALSDRGSLALSRRVDGPRPQLGLFDGSGVDAQEAVADEPPTAPAAALVGAPMQRRVVPERIPNTFQAPYQAASRVGEASAMIPINMSGATYAALNDLERRHGPVDAYVANKLQYDVEELRSAKYFSPEQVDAIAMAIQAVESGRGMINADQTGLGKGRFVAAMLRYARLNECLAVFVTIKPELFTDLFRDIADIGSQHLFTKPFIFNDGVSVKRFGTERDVLFPATRSADRAVALDAGELPVGTDLVLATYSQFQRAYEVNRKSRLLSEISHDGAMLLLDEAHVAAGASNIAFAVGQGVANAQSVVYASATPLKGVSNFAIYNKIFPPSVDMDTLPDTLHRGGEAMLEAISTNMARDGVLIRREHDFSRLVFHTRMPAQARAEANVAMANQLADILARMSVLSGDVSAIVSEINREMRDAWKDIPQEERKGTRMGASSMSFGSRLYSINRQFLLGIKIDEAIAASVDALREGRKPVIAVENTGESLLRQVIGRRAGVDEMSAELELIEEKGEALETEDRLRRDELVAAINGALRAVTLEEPPQFRELLEIMLERIARIKVQGRYGDVSWRAPESEEYYEAEAAIREMIAEFPDLPLTPLDVVRKELHLLGFQVAEVSGRTLSIAPADADPARWAVHFHDKADAVANVAGFQSGRYDAIIITRSGSTGISLHATDRFANSDTRQRDFIVLQKAANIAEFLQWMGRVNRKDQVNDPVITSIESGLPAELRLTMMHNTKLRKLSANTTSNRDNANLEGDFDLLNDIGDQVALGWLMENPDTAEYLDIDLPDDDGREPPPGEAHYINKLLGRLMLVRVDQQEALLASLTEQFNDRLQELEAAGENPFRVDAHEWGAEVVREKELETGIIRGTGSTFDEPVRLTTLRFEVPVQPVRAHRLREWIADALLTHARAGVTDSDGGLRSYRRDLAERRERFVREQLPEKLQAIDGPLSLLLAQSPSARRAAEKAEWLIGCVERFRPGTFVVVQDAVRGDRDGLLVRTDFPASRAESFLLSKYRLAVLFPGEEKPAELTLATLRSQGQTLGPTWGTPSEGRRFDNLVQRFDAVGQGNQIRTVHVLQGNLFRACEMAAHEKLGGPILYTDREGNRHRAVLLKDRVTPEMVQAIPLGFDARDLLAYVREYLRPDHPRAAERRHFGKLRVFNSPVKAMEPGDGIELTLLNQGAGFLLSIPGTKAHAGALLADGSIFDLGERSEPQGLRLSLAGTRAVMRAEVSMNQFSDLLDRLQGRRHVSKFYVPEPDSEIITRLKAEAGRPAMPHREPEQISTLSA